MRKTLIFVLAFTILSLVFGQSALAIGQMTEPIVIKDVLRGQVLQETLILYGGEQETTFGLVADGDIKDWTTFYLPGDLENPISEIKIPANSHLDAVAQFKLPEDVPNGTYAGVVAVFSLPEAEKESEGVSTSVRLRVDREVSITVTDQEIIKLETTIIPLEYGMAKNEPLKIKVIYDNQGNVMVKPNLQLKVVQISTGEVIHNAIYPYPETEEAVKPLERKEFPALVEWQTTGQKGGEYRAEIKVLISDEVYKEENFKFSIGSTSGQGLTIFGLEISWLVIVMALVVIIIAIIFIKKRK